MKMDLSGVRWLEADENPYGIRVLDCRSVTGKLVSSSSEEGVVDRFLALRRYDYEQLDGRVPDNPVPLDCNLVYPEAEGFNEGLHFTAEVMEDKWDIYHVGEYLYFLRSWTGMLVFRAHIPGQEGAMAVDSIQVSAGVLSGEPLYSICQVDFLIKSHLYRREVPHPLPLELPEDPASLVLFSFSQYGRWAFYGSYDDTSSIRIL